MGTSYSPNIVKDGLVFQVDPANPRSYPGSGTTATDLINNIAGTLSGPNAPNNTPQWENTNGGVFDFDGTDDYIEVQDSTTNTFGFANKTNSISAWIKVDDLSTERPIASKRETGSPGKRHWIFTIQDGNVKLFAYHIDSQSDVAISNSTLSTGVWYHITVTLTTTQTKIYIDGVLDKTHTNTYSTIQNDQADLNIGRRGANADIRYFNGKISCTQIYTKALSAQEVKQNYNAMKARFR